MNSHSPPSNTLRPFAFALLLSAFVNAAGIFTITELNAPLIYKKQEVKEILFDLRSLPQQQTFIDTPLEPTPSEKDTDHLSDKDSRADSSMQGKETGILPQSENKDLFPQAQRNGSPPLFLQQQIQKAIEEAETEQKKAAQEMTQKMSVEGAQLVLPETNTKIQTPYSYADSQTDSYATPQLAEDIFSLPIISLGDLTKSKDGRDAFEAKGSDLGKYLKIMRDKIGLHFYKMLFFHYRTNYIFGSRAKVKFLIEPEGSLRDLSVELVEGDPLFAEYCLTVIRNAEPFMPLHKGLAPHLEDGALKIDFLFGYDVRKSDKKKDRGEDS